MRSFLTIRIAKKKKIIEYQVMAKTTGKSLVLQYCPQWYKLIQLFWR